MSARLAFAAGLALALAACGASEEPAPPPARDEAPASEPEPTSVIPAMLGTSTPLPNPCGRPLFEDVLFTHCIADPTRHSVRLVLGPDNGPPYRGFGKFAEDYAETVPPVLFAMNAGMFDDEGQPIGLFIADGEKLKLLNTNKGPGNFHMLPNGVFHGLGEEWAVSTTEDYAAREGAVPEFATQSGPMLLIDGKLHPAIAKDGSSRLIRNAVGVDAAGRAHFVISEGPVSFGKLARFFRDRLRIANALYLDGTVSALYNPAGARIDAGPPLGPLVVVTERVETDEDEEDDAA